MGSWWLKQMIDHKITVCSLWVVRVQMCSTFRANSFYEDPEWLVPSSSNNGHSCQTWWKRKHSWSGEPSAFSERVGPTFASWRPPVWTIQVLCRWHRVPVQIVGSQDQTPRSTEPCAECGGDGLHGLVPLLQVGSSLIGRRSRMEKQSRNLLSITEFVSGDESSGRCLYLLCLATEDSKQHQKVVL